MNATYVEICAVKGCGTDIKDREFFWVHMIVHHFELLNPRARESGSMFVRPLFKRYRRA